MITKERMIEFLEDARKFDSIIERDKLERKVDELEKALERKAGELVKALERIPGHCKEEE